VTCGKVLLGEGNLLLPLWQQRMEDLLMAGDMNATIDELMACLFGASLNERKAINDLVRYFRTNEKRMKYASFLDVGLPIGSGYVESAHRHVLQARMKRAGQQLESASGRAHGSVAGCLSHYRPWRLSCSHM